VFGTPLKSLDVEDLGPELDVQLQTSSTRTGCATVQRAPQSTLTFERSCLIEPAWLTPSPGTIRNAWVGGCSLPGGRQPQATICNAGVRERSVAGDDPLDVGYVRAAKARPSTVLCSLDPRDRSRTKSCSACSPGSPRSDHLAARRRPRSQPDRCWLPGAHRSTANQNSEPWRSTPSS